MEKLGFYFDKQIYYVSLIRTKNKRLYLKIKDDKIVASIPKGIKEKEIRSFVEPNLPKFIKYIKEKRKNRLYSIEDNFLFYLGKKYSLSILTGFKTSSWSIKDEVIYIKVLDGYDDEVLKAIKKFLKKDLTNYLEKKLIRFEKEMKSIKHTFTAVYKTSTWGTNFIDKQKISFSSRLVHYRREITDYVIVHEIAHSFEPNHSNEFWEIVKLYIPNFKELRNELKPNRTLSY